MKEKILLIWKHLKQGTLKKMWKQTLWIYQYGRRYWKAMILYTLLGLVGTGVSLVSSLISRDLVDIITGHQTGKLIRTCAARIGFSVANILVSQASGYASTFINLKVDSEIKNDIFAKILVSLGNPNPPVVISSASKALFTAVTSSLPSTTIISFII